MVDEHKAAFRVAFTKWFKGNEYAVALCMDLLLVAHAWDDLIDEDKGLSEQEIDEAFLCALVSIPANPFFAQNSQYLLPVFHSVWLQWKVANVFEREKQQHDMEKAYMLRASIYQVFQMVALLCGGRDWAVEVGPEVWRLYGEAPGASHA